MQLLSIILFDAVFVLCPLSVHADLVLLEPPDSGELPLFGRQLLYYDTETGKALPSARTAHSRLKDYFHPCVKRSPLKTADEASIKKWAKNNFNRRSLDYYSKPIHKSYRKKLSEVEYLMESVAAECFRYNRKADFSTSIGTINKFYSQDFAMKWDGLGQWKKYGRQFDRIFASVVEDIHSKLDVLDSIHIAEFETWKAENPELFDRRRRSIIDVKRDFEYTVKFNATKREAKNARVAAKSAEESAISAKKSAASAAASASDAAAGAAAARRAADDAKWKIEQERMMRW